MDRKILGFICVLGLAIGVFGYSVPAAACSGSCNNCPCGSGYECRSSVNWCKQQNNCSDAECAGSCSCRVAGPPPCSSACGACFDCDVCVTVGGAFILTEQALATLPRYSSADQGEEEANGVRVACSAVFAKAWADMEISSALAQTDAAVTPEAVHDNPGVYLAVWVIPVLMFMGLAWSRLVFRRPVRVLFRSPRSGGKR